MQVRDELVHSAVHHVHRPGQGVIEDLNAAEEGILKSNSTLLVIHFSCIIIIIIIIGNIKRWTKTECNRNATDNISCG